MQLEKLKKNNHKKVIIGGLIVVSVLSAIILTTTRAKYRTTQSINIASGTVNYKPADLNMVAMYQENASGGWDAIDVAPTNGYLLNTTESNCSVNGTKDTSIGITYSGGKVTISNLTKKGTKCYLYFDKIKDTTAPTISNVAISDTTKTSFKITVTASDDTGVTKYYYSKDNGATYTEITTNTYTFTGLTAGTTYNVKVYVEDAAGNKSTVTSKSVTTTPNGQTASTILAGLTKAGARPNYQTLTTDNSGKVFSLEDDDGTSYYFAGAVTDNWVKFGEFYWRIIRFNGDGTIRLIYSGTTAATTGTGTQIGTSAFNSSYNDNMYVGYRYTNGQVHGTGTASTIQTYIDDWYKENIVDKGYSSKVDTNAGFCGDRDNYTNKSGTTAGGGTGTTVTYYVGYVRFFTSGSANSNPTPTLKCKNTSDLYTSSTSTKGNKSLTYPVGLISADEANTAGAIYGTTNQSYYLYTEQSYWTMSAYNFSGSHASVSRVRSDGSIGYNSVAGTYGVRPVINLRADTEFTGDGTSSNPYIVQ